MQRSKVRATLIFILKTFVIFALARVLVEFSVALFPEYGLAMSRAIVVLFGIPFIYLAVKPYVLELGFSTEGSKRD